jgi:hypothetical protein
VGGAIRAAGTDLYYHSVRFVPANAAWGAALVAWIFLAGWLGILVGLLLLPLLAIPFSGVARLAALVARRRDVGLSDAWQAWRLFVVASLRIGLVVTLLIVALLTNLRLGAALGGPAGALLAALALWGLVILWLVLLPLWLVVVDPAREAWPFRDQLTVVGYLLLADARRLVILGVLQFALLVVSAVLVAVLLTAAVAYVALLTAHAVLPAADRVSIAMPGRLPPLALAPTADEPPV